MRIRKSVRRFAVVSAAVLALVVGAAASRADNVTPDGDAVVTATQNVIAFGDVACGSTLTKTAAVMGTRNGGVNNNTWANGAQLTVTATGSGAGVSVPGGPLGTTILPGNWTTIGNGFDSDPVPVTVTLHSTIAGAGTGSVTFTASGMGAQGGTVVRTAAMNVTWKTGTCVTTLATTTTVTCPAAPQTYTGAALQPCTALTTASDGWSASVPVTYADNVNAGTATASATWAGDGTHLASSGTGHFSIGKATSSVSISCPSNAVFTGAALTPCTGSAVAAGALDPTVPVVLSYTSNTHAGTAGVTGSWAGDANHTAGTGTGSYIISRASSVTTLSCPSDAIYDGSAHPCTGSVSGPGGLTAIPTIGYNPGNFDAGPVSATGTYPGDGDHLGSTGTANFTIGRAASSVTLTCTSNPQVYDGSAHDVCTASVDGAGGLHESVPVSYGDNINAGMVTASADYQGDGNHAPSSNSATFTIAKAPSTVSVTCDPGSVTYTGNPQTPCTAKVTGAGGLSQPLTVSYADNTDTGTATASAAYAGDSNHNGDSGNASFQVTQAPSSVTVQCVNVTYSGLAQEPCTATVDGVGVIDSSVAVTWTYAANTDAGPATAAAMWAGDRNHTGSSGTGGFTIGKAASTTAGTCPHVTYTGAAQEPCTGAPGGPGVLDVTSTNLYWGYWNNTNAGTAHATLYWDGDANHSGSDSGDLSFTIAQAASTVTVTCPSHVTFTSGALTPCTANAAGIGMTDVPLSVAYAANVHAGTASASASWDGDANHTGNNGSTPFTIDPAASATTVTCPSNVAFTGSPVTPCSATATGLGGLNVAVPVTYTNNTLAGTATAKAVFGGDGDHLGSTGQTTFTIDPWRLLGFYQPVDMNGVWNTVKNGATVPLKFEVFTASTEITTTAQLGAAFTVKGVSCPGASAATDDVELTTTGGTTLRYDATAGQFIQNWQTPKNAGACYQVTMTSADATAISALFKLK